MRRGPVLWSVGILGVLVAVPLAVRGCGHMRAEAELRRELALARAEGLPTSGAEFRALIPSAAPAENAALLYRKLKDFGRLRSVDDNITYRLMFRGNASDKAAAKQALDARAQTLATVDEAAKLPKCWFDRPWEQGAAVLMPEFADMKGGAKLVSLRGSLAAANGDVAGALQDAREMLRIAEHCGQEPTTIAHLVREAIYAMTAQKLACWSFVYRRPEYAAEMKRVMDALPKPDLKTEHRDELFMMLSLVDQSTTPEGRKKLGLREEDVPGAEKLFPLFLDRGKAKVEIVEAERDYWRALDLRGREQADGVGAARQKLYEGLLAYPTAASLYGAFYGMNNGEDPALTRVQSFQARRQEYLLLARALEQSPIPAKLETHLKSPFNGKPLRYRFDSKQIVIETDTDDEPRTLKMPPDAALKALKAPPASSNASTRKPAL